nr:McrC family protein [Cytophagales bacterium]
WLPRHRTVWDTKYKLLDTNGPPVSDLYQMAAYCKARQVTNAHLLYAATEPQPSETLHIAHTSLRVHVHSLSVVAPETTDEFGVLTEKLKEQLWQIAETSL